MNNEYEGHAYVKNTPWPVTCYYELDGIKPLGLYICDLAGKDITESVPESEYDRLYNEVCELAGDRIADKQEDRRDHEREDKAYAEANDFGMPA